MPRIIFKTIVTGSYELPYVLLNLLELEHICDEFLITEPNRTHTGEIREFKFEHLFDEHIRNRFPAARYIKMDISKNVQPWSTSNKTDEALRWNEFLTRSSFINYIEEPQDRDIFISVDGDEVICDTPHLRLILLFLKIWPFKRPLAFLLTLRHFLFYINLYMSQYDFYSPSIAHSKFYKLQEFPHWRGGGKRISRPLGCHFSWMMSPQEMRLKILNYGHSDRLRHLSSLETLKSIKAGNYQLFEPNVPLGPIQIMNYKSKKMPKSIHKVKDFFDPQLILDYQNFWKK
jgi:hypothetical protein